MNTLNGPCWRLRIYLLIMSLTFLAGKSQAATPRISCDDLRAMQLRHEPGLVVVDVRSPAYFKSKHIDGAINVPHHRITRGGLPKTGILILYCTGEGCSLSADAAQMLTTAGYSNARVLTGGIAEWESKGYPLFRKTQEAASQANEQVPSISAREFSSRQEGSIVIDLRPAREFSAGHLPRAINIPLEELESKIDALDKSKDVIVYDRDKRRSAAGARLLFQKGFQVRELAGGIQVWIALKYPLAV